MSRLQQVVLTERERMILVLKTYALDIPLQETVTTILSHNDNNIFIYSIFTKVQNFSMIHFSQCRLKSNYKSSKQLTDYLNSKVSIPVANNYLVYGQGNRHN